MSEDGCDWQWQEEEPELQPGRQALFRGRMASVSRWGGRKLGGAQVNR